MKLKITQKKNYLNSVLFICVMGVMMLKSVSGYEITENEFPDYKIEQYGDIKIMSVKDYSCDWKPDNENDGFKSCGLEISIYNGGLYNFGLLMNENNFNLEITKPVTATYYYTNDVLVLNESLDYDNWKQMDNSISVANPDKFISIKIVFELPQYEGAEYNLTYIPLGIKLDPNISACGRLGSSGVYTLIQNITATKDCLIIGKDDITVNLNGYNISGDGGAGDYGVDNSKDNLIVNGPGTITNFEHGIDTDGNYGTFNNFSVDTTNSGVYLGIGSNHNIVENINSYDNTNGIYTTQNTNNTFRNNNLISDNTGIFLFGSLAGVDVINTTIINNTFNFNRQGIYHFRADGSLIENNTFNSATRYAIRFGFSENNIFRNNNIWNTSSVGSFASIYLHESSNNTFRNNVINKSFNWGIWLDSTQTAWTTSHNLFRDMTLTNIDNTSVISISVGSPATININNTFLNVTYNNESIDANSELIRQWYYRAYVNDTDGNDVNNTNVTAKNVSNILQFYGLTNSSGYTIIFNITEYYNYFGVKTFWSLYNITATNVTCTDFHSYNVSDELNNLMDVFTLCGEIPPPANGTGGNPNIVIWENQTFGMVQLGVINERSNIPYAQQGQKLNFTELNTMQLGNGNLLNNLINLGNNKRVVPETLLNTSHEFSNFPITELNKP